MNTDTYKKILQGKEAELVQSLGTIATPRVGDKNDWEATDTDVVDEAEEGEVASKHEQFEDNVAVSDQLETELALVRAALTRIEAGTYGICDVCGTQIEEDRLAAEPAATTCKAHM